MHRIIWYHILTICGALLCPGCFVQEAFEAAIERAKQATVEEISHWKEGSDPAGAAATAAAGASDPNHPRQNLGGALAASLSASELEGGPTRTPSRGAGSSSQPSAGLRTPRGPGSAPRPSTASAAAAGGTPGSAPSARRSLAGHSALTTGLVTPRRVSFGRAVTPTSAVGSGLATPRRLSRGDVGGSSSSAAQQVAGGGLDVAEGCGGFLTPRGKGSGLRGGDQQQQGPGSAGKAPVADWAEERAVMLSVVETRILSKIAAVCGPTPARLQQRRQLPGVGGAKVGGALLSSSAGGGMVAGAGTSSSTAGVEGCGEAAAAAGGGELRGESSGASIASSGVSGSGGTRRGHEAAAGGVAASVGKLLGRGGGAGSKSASTGGGGGLSSRRGGVFKV